MQSVGLNYEEYNKLIVGVPASPILSVNTTRAIKILQACGYTATLGKVAKLAAKGVVPDASDSGASSVWDEDRINVAARYFEERQDFTPLAGFLADEELTLRDYYAALHLAAKDAIERFGRPAEIIIDCVGRPNPDQFVMSLTPPYGDEEPSITFSLRDSILQQVAPRRSLRNIETVG